MSDFHARFDEARKRLPIQRLMEQRGRAIENGKCPYCHKKGASIYEGKFKCFHTHCPSGTYGECGSWDEIAFMAHELGLTRSEATGTYFKEAGVWKEAESHAPSVLPGQRRRKKEFPKNPETTLPSSTSPQAPSAGEDSSSRLAGRSSSASLDSAATSGSESYSDEDRTAVPEPRPVASDSSASSPGSSPVRDEAPLSRAETAPEAPAENRTDTQSAEAHSSAGEPKSKAFHRARNVEQFFAMLALVEKRRFCFLDLERSVGYAAAKELIEFMGAHQLVLPVENEQYVPAPDWKEKLAKSLEPEPDKAPVLPPEGGGPAKPPPPGKPTKEELPPGPPPLSALRWFYRRLHLSEADRNGLWLKRGLTEATCAALGYRSNPEENKKILLAMAELYPPAVLVDCGLWVEGEKATEKPKPNPQFHGMSVREKRDEDGKKVRDEDGKPIRECVWDHPILIPYFDEAGELVHLRPHKGMMKDKPMRLYVARPCKEFLDAQAQPLPAPQFAGITEGEFKAGALWQVLADQMAIASLPGITMAKPLFGDIEEWLDKCNVRRVVIGYDNEEKADPKLPGYKREEFKRFDAEVWARYLARQLAKEGYEAKVARLPNEWRDAKGKADWDGRLAQIIHGSTQTSDLLVPENTVDKWKAFHAVAREQFLEVINNAGPVNELWQMGFFDSKDERIIKNQLEKISYEPRLPIGGENEIALARRLQRLCMKTKGNDERLTGKARGFLMNLAAAYQDARGGYYIFKPLSEPKQGEWMQRLAKAADMGDTEVKRTCEIALKGIPTRISDFYLKAHYVLNRLNGTRCRLVTIHSMHGVKTEMLTLPSAPFAQPSKFREWLLDSCTVATWRAGERELQDLQADVGRDVAFKDVAEVPIRGFHADSKLWMYRDVTYTPDGKELFADKNGIIWYDGRAYRLAETDHEKQSFRHKEVMMHPEVKMKKDEGVQLFLDLANKLFDTVGGYEGWLALSMILAYAATPEIFDAFNGFPGLWLHGETGQGKTSIALWLMRIWGYSIKQGIALKDSTKVGLSIALQQYGSLPVFLEEFQPNADEWQIEKLKYIFDRLSGNKKTFDEGDRRVIAGAIVTGIATARDAQTKNRYAHVQVSAANRLGNHYEWFQKNCDRFFLIGRMLMKNRKEFAASVVATIREWMHSPDLEKIDERARLVHGTAYGAFKAVNDMLKAFEEPAVADFRKQLIIHSTQSVKEVHEQINVNQFWLFVLNALSGDAFGQTPAERRGIFKERDTPKPPKPDISEKQIIAGSEESRKLWTPKLLYFRPGPVIDMLRMYMRKQGRELPLEKNDLRAQMETRPYWVRTGELGTAKYSDNVHRMKFHGSDTPQSCWCINLDKHELGYRKVSDEEFNNSLFSDEENMRQGVFIKSEEWIDPRRGDLFALIDSLRSQRQEAGNES